MTRLASVTAALLLTACGPNPVSPPPERETMNESRPTKVAAPSDGHAPSNNTAPTLAVEGEGLRLFNPANGAARPLPFGTARDTIMTTLGSRGAADSGVQSECGAGSLDYAAWPDGLKLYFQRGKLTGWALDGRAAGKVATASGIGPGSSRRELEAAYTIKVMESTLGTEFTAGDLAGLLDSPAPDAAIDAMWAGTSCNFQ